MKFNIIDIDCIYGEKYIEIDGISVILDLHEGFIEFDWPEDYTYPLLF